MAEIINISKAGNLSDLEEMVDDLIKLRDDGKLNKLFIAMQTLGSTNGDKEVSYYWRGTGNLSDMVGMIELFKLTLFDTQQDRTNE